MNKKLLAGVSLVAIAAASFWACGEGNINQMTVDDQILEQNNDADLEALKKEALDSCLADDVCKLQYAAYFANPNGDTPPDETPSSNSNSGSNPGQSSSSIKNNNPFDIQPDVSSSSIARNDDLPPVEQSSSSVKVITGLGMCEPVTTPIDKVKGSTKWKFTPNLDAGYKPVAFANAKFAWNFGAGATPATDATPSTSAAVSYANSGTATASLTVTMSDGNAETIQCEPLQVNGDPITGCKCAPEGVTGSVDYTTTPDVTWSVTGCTSASTPLSYNWEGADGAESYTHSFTAATASYAPKLKVGNADNTVIDVTCSAVKVTEGAEYTIKDNTDAGKISLPGAGTYNVVIAFACQNKTFFCNGVGGPVGGSVNGTPMKSDWYTTASLSAEDCTGSATVSVEVTGAATCGAQ
ncbi:MAG: hypothetical protein IK114_00825 [Fibrobacter sp.]|nr:hypothetical protein [Fibrobacter sp.]